MAYYGFPQFPGHNPYQYWQYPGAYNPAHMSNPYALHHRQFPGMSSPFSQVPALPAIRPPTTQPPTTTQAQAPAVSIPQPDMTVATQAHASNMAMSQMAMNPDGLKFKCMICGRFRSTHYHLKHRLAPGQLPGPTICRRCRKHTTESESETSDSEEDDLLYRSRSATRNRSRSRSRLRRAASTARSSSRMGRRREDFDYYALHSVEDSSSGSEDLPPRSGKSRSRRARSVRYTDESQPVKRAKSKTRRVIYMQEPSVQSEELEDEVEVRYIKQAPEYVNSRCFPDVGTNVSRNAVVRSRSRIRASPGLLQHLSTELSQPVYVEQRVYYDEPPASFSGKPLPPAEFKTNNPYRNIPVSHVEHHIPTSGYQPQQYIRHPPVSGAVQPNQPPIVTEDHGCFGYKNGPSIPYAPTPPELYQQRSRNSSYEAEFRPGSIDQERVTRARSRLRSRGRRRSSEQGFREEQEPSADDYDWYDADGMKVRVREI